MADDAEGVQRRVIARMARRTLLNRPDAPSLVAIVDEAALRRPVGGSEVMREQLGELLRPRGNVTVRVVPYAVGAHPGLEGGFVLLDFPEETTFPTEVYAESIAGDLYPESADQVARISLARPPRDRGTRQQGPTGAEPRLRAGIVDSVHRAGEGERA